MTLESSSVPITDELLSIAQSFVPLCSLKPSYLEFLLLQQASVDYYCAGHVLFERGVCDYQHIYLLNGQVRLQFSKGYSETINASEYFDPIANEMPRPCQAIANTDCTVLKIESERLDRILSWSQISQYLLSDMSIKRDFDEDIAWIKTVLNSNLFYKVPPVNAEQILGRMHARIVEEGEVILREGEIGDCCYFIKEGSASVYKHDRSKVIHLADIGVGRCFGEDALVYETYRNATVKMKTAGVLMRLAKTDFMRLLIEPKVDELTEADTGHFDVSPVYIDVRTLAEYDGGHLAMAANLPLALLSIEKRLLNIEIPYVTYCDTGRRSRSAAYLLSKQGYRVASLQGGLLGAGMQHQLVHDTSYILKDGRAVKAINP